MITEVVEQLGIGRACHGGIDIVAIRGLAEAPGAGDMGLVVQPYIASGIKIITRLKPAIFGIFVGREGPLQPCIGIGREPVGVVTVYPERLPGLRSHNDFHILPCSGLVFIDHLNPR